MCQFLQNNWKELVGFFIAVVGIWQYLDTRKNELSWKRTEFLFNQAEKLENDDELKEIIHILEGRNNDITIEKIINGNIPEYLQKLDKLLNFLDRLAYAYLNQKTLSKIEIENFGWYLQRISENTTLTEYCKKNGFKDLIILSEELKK